MQLKRLPHHEAHSHYIALAMPLPDAHGYSLPVKTSIIYFDNQKATRKNNRLAMKKRVYSTRSTTSFNAFTASTE